MEQTEVGFTTTDLSEAIARAARVAPTKGEAFDKAAGIVLSANADTKTVEVFATNLEVDYRETVTPSEFKGPSATWRVSSFVVDGVLQTLPKNEKDLVYLIGRGDDKIRIKCGATVTALQLLDMNTYISMTPTPVFHGIVADEMASKVEQVEWATDPKGGKLGGVMMDGQRLVGCNSYCIALVPCELDITEPIVVPMNTLKTLVKGAPSVRMSNDNKNRLYVSLDEHTTCSTTLIQEAYPVVGTLMREEYAGTFSFHKGAFADSMNRMNALGRQDRMPFVDMSLEYGMFTRLILDISIQGVGRMRDELDVTTEYDGAFELTFQPTWIEKAISSCRGDLVFLDFGIPGDPLKQTTVRIRDEHGYQCYVIPRRKAK